MSVRSVARSAQMIPAPILATENLLILFLVQQQIDRTTSACMWTTPKLASSNVNGITHARHVAAYSYANTGTC